MASASLAKKWSKRRKRWEYQIRFREPGGKQRWQRLGISNQAVALARLADKRRALDQARATLWTDDVEEAIVRFVRSARIRCGPRTADGYEQCIRAIAAAFHPTPLAQWSRGMFEAFVDGRLHPAAPEDHAERAQRPWSARTVQAHVRIARMFIRSAPAADVDCPDFVGTFRGPRVERRIPRYLVPEELDALLAEVHEHETLEVPIGLGALAGLRFGEIDRLEAADVDRREHGLVIRKTKSHRDRVVPISSALWEILERHPVISGKVARLGNARNARRDLAAACKRANFDGVGWHALRHTFGMRLAEEGVPPHEIRDLMGHASIATTDIYMTARPKRLAPAVEKVLARKPAAQPAAAST